MNVKRYTEKQKMTILKKIDSAPHYTEAIKQSGVSYATIRTWKMNMGIPMKRAGGTQKKEKALGKGTVAQLFKIANEHLAMGAKLKTLLAKL